MKKIEPLEKYLMLVFLVANEPWDITYKLETEEGDSNLHCQLYIEPTTHLALYKKNVKLVKLHNICYVLFNILKLDTRLV